MGHQPFVSVIIPVYNVEAYIEECLRSVMQQTCTEFECILVNDCTPDRSMEIARRTIADYSGPIEFRAIDRQKNGGLSAARNSGIREAHGEYVYFLDSDDVITPDCMDSLINRAREYPKAEIVCGDFQTFPQKDVHVFLSLQGKDFPPFSDDINWIRSVFLSTFPVISCNKLINRDFICLNKLYFKEGVLHEDNHWQAQAYHHIHAIAVVEKVTYLYRMREGSITNNNNTDKRRLENMFAICKDIFSKRVGWDYPWAYWTIRSLDSFRFSKDIDRETSNQYVDSLSGILLENPTVPVPVKLLQRYMKMSKWIYHPRLYNIGSRIYLSWLKQRKNKSL